MDKIKVALIEDQHLFRNGVNALLREVEDFEVLAAVENGKIFLDLLSGSEGIPHVILVDINMPELNGFDLTCIVQKLYPSIKIIILTVYNQERFISKMVEAGVAGYLVKNCDIEEVILAIRTAHKSGFYFNESTLSAIRKSFKIKNSNFRSLSNIPIDLTVREIEILKLICQEHTNSEIALQLHISSRTVDGHRNNLLAKIGCKNTAGLVLFAVNNHIYESTIFR